MRDLPSLGLPPNWRHIWWWREQVIHLCGLQNRRWWDNWDMLGCWQKRRLRAQVGKEQETPESILATLADSILATLANSILVSLANSILARSPLARITLPTALGRSQTCLLWPSTDAKWDLQELLLGPNLDWGALLSFSALLLLMLFRILRLPRCIFLLLLCGKDFSLNLFARSFANTLFVVMGKEIDYN